MRTSSSNPTGSEVVHRQQSTSTEEDKFSATKRPDTVTKKCPSWTLNVTVTVVGNHVIGNFEPQKNITIQLDCIGYYTGSAKPGKNQSYTGLFNTPVPPFTGKGKARFKVSVLTNLEDWFCWTSQSVDVALKDNDSKNVDIQIQPNLALIAMAGIAALKPRVTDGQTCLDDYGMTNNITAAHLRKILGSSSLTQGGVDTRTMIAKAGILQSLLDFRAPPFFSVIDLNLSHQMSYFLSCLAFHRHGKHSKRLVINFDNHKDYSGSTGLVMYDKWGAGYFTNAAELDQFLGAGRVVYTTIGETSVEWTNPKYGLMTQIYCSNETIANTPNDPGTFLGVTRFRTNTLNRITVRKIGKWNLRHCKEDVVPSTYYDQEDVQELIDKGLLTVESGAWPGESLMNIAAGPLDPRGLRDKNGPLVEGFNRINSKVINMNTCAGDDFLNGAYVGTDLSDTDVYITVDRDVSQRSFTYWGDGYMTAAEMRSAVDRCLTYLRTKNANLVGFDIAGLPDSKGSSEALGILAVKQGLEVVQGGDPGDQEQAIIQQAKDDIQYFFDKVRAYGPT